MLKRSMIVVAVLLIASAKASAQEPQWLKDARAREGSDLKEQTFRSKDGLFSGRVLGTVVTKDIVEEGGSYTIEINMGSDSAAACEVYLDGFDMASGLRSIADATMKILEQEQGKLEGRAIERMDAGVIGPTPYLAIDWLYRANDGKGAKVGGIKQVALTKNGVGIYCAHTELGFAKTFQNLVRTLAESLQMKDPHPAPYFTEIGVIKVQGQKVGLAMTTMVRDDDGDTKARTATSMAIPVTPETLRTEDEIHIEFIKPDGSLINAHQISSMNGELETTLTLEQSEGKWTVEGEFNGKALKKTLDGASAPTTAIQEARTRRALFGKKDAVGTTFKTLHWTTADPTRILEAETTILKVIDADHMATKETLEGISLETVIERVTGLPSLIKMQTGPVSMEVERVFVQGAF
jgi:hypothetical protein